MSTHDLKRLHGLDALRAAMMLLGLVLHAGVSYITVPIPEAWPYNDGRTSALFDWVVFFIHLFRMPTFFVMAGFFAAFLYYREGAAGFLNHRTRRLLLPLAAAWILLFPPTSGGFVYALSGGGSAGLGPAVTYLADTPYAGAKLAHLWFIYYLFIFCLAAIVIAPALERIGAGTRERALAAFARVTPTVWGCLLFGLISGVSMIPMTKPGLDTALNFLPAARVLIAYAVFFSFGWLLFARKELVTFFAAHPWRYLTTGFVAGVIYLVVAVGQPLGTPTANHLAGVAAAGIAMWLLIYGITGVFVRYFASPRPLQRYLSDASYWMYLTHLPIVVWTAGLLGPVAVPAIVKFTIVLAVTTVVTLVTYHYFVRSTVIGAFLNGRRFDRALPTLDAVGPATVRVDPRG